MKLSAIGYICLLLSIPFLAVANEPEKQCLPALDPDLNNDGVADYLDLWLVGRSFQLPPDDDRYINAADTHCDGQVDAADWRYVWDGYGKNYPAFVEIEGCYLDIMEAPQIYVGKETSINSFVRVWSTLLNVGGKDPSSIKITRTITPNKGMVLKKPIQAKEYGLAETIADEAFRLKKGEMIEKNLPFTFMPEQAGEYEFNVRVEMTDTRKVFQQHKTLTILPEKKS